FAVLRVGKVICPVFTLARTISSRSTRIPTELSPAAAGFAVSRPEAAFLREICFISRTRGPARGRIRWLPIRKRLDSPPMPELFDPMVPILTAADTAQIFD